MKEVEEREGVGRFKMIASNSKVKEKTVKA